MLGEIATQIKKDDVKAEEPPMKRKRLVGKSKVVPGAEGSLPLQGGGDVDDEKDNILADLEGEENDDDEDAQKGDDGKAAAADTKVDDEDEGDEEAWEAQDGGGASSSTMKR